MTLAAKSAHKPSPVKAFLSSKSGSFRTSGKVFPRKYAILMLIPALGMTLSGAKRLPGADWYVAPHGSADGAGTRESPWDIHSALGGSKPIRPGDTLWLAGGTYRHPDRSIQSPGFVVRLAGEPDRPIHIRALPGQRVTLDGGLTIQPPSDFLWIWDLEILVSENFTMSRRIEEPGSHPKTYGRPWGGLNIHTGRGCKYIHLVIHDNAQGISFWRGVIDSEVYGCIIYDNGWDAPDRGHGHAIYTQNEAGIKTIADCIMTGGFSHTMHAYGSRRAFVQNYLIEGNIAYNAGRFLVGGEGPTTGIRLLRNFLYRVNMQVGYTAPENGTCEVRDNVIVGGTLNIIRFREVNESGNLVVPPNSPPPADRPFLYELRPSRYDPHRAHLVVYNWTGNDSLPIPLQKFLRSGDRFQLKNPRDFFGPPVWEGTFTGSPVAIPVPGEFAAYVVLRRPTN